MAEEALPLPALQEALLDDETLARLFMDLEELTQVDEVLLKGGTTTMAMPGRHTLAEGRRALLEGGVRGLQVRYRYGGQEWCDTLLRMSQGVKLIRMEQRPPQDM